MCLHVPVEAFAVQSVRKSIIKRLVRLLHCLGRVKGAFDKG